MAWIQQQIKKALTSLPYPKDCIDDVWSIEMPMIAADEPNSVHALQVPPNGLPLNMTQNSYNIFLMEKTSHHLNGAKYRKNVEKFTRKMYAKDFLVSFGKCARSINIDIPSYDIPLSASLAQAVRFKYDIDLSEHVGTPLRAIAEAMAKFPRSKGDVPFERRKD